VIEQGPPGKDQEPAVVLGTALETPNQAFGILESTGVGAIEALV